MIEQLLKEIRRASDALLTNGTLQSEHGNKAAGTRARKATGLSRVNTATRLPAPVPAKPLWNWSG